MSGSAAIYARISKDKEERQQGVERREALCRELARRHGLTVAAVLVDNDISASTNSTKMRPQYCDVLQCASR